MARLTARARATVTSLTLRVELDASELCVIGEKVLSDATRNAWVDRERSALLSTMPPQPRRSDWMSYAVPDIGSYSERRSRDEFRTEVEAYAASVSSRWMTVVAVGQVESEESELVPVVVNETEENFEDVVVELTLPFNRNSVYVRPHEAGSRLNPPERPDDWGRGLLGRLSLPQIAPALPRPPEPDIEMVEQTVTLVRFPALHVRPHTRHRLQRLLLALPPALAGRNVSVGWRATARNTPGQQQGAVDLSIPGLDSACELEP
jgi:hypothetical protein